MYFVLASRQAIESAGDRKKWQAAWEGFRDAWNGSWKFVDRFGCTPIPPTFKSVGMSESITISFCMPCEEDEGICPLQLARFLGERHNQFVQAVDEHLLMRGEDMQRGEDRDHVISSKFFTQAQTLTYDLEGTFVPFLEKQCVHIGRNGQASYDYKNAQHFLLDV